jgi:hypothetical protein
LIANVSAAFTDLSCPCVAAAGCRNSVAFQVILSRRQRFAFTSLASFCRPATSDRRMWAADFCYAHCLTEVQLSHNVIEIASKA